jgi:hypothetical protein
MTSVKGKLTPSDKAKIIDWLNEKSPNHKCPSCGQNSWLIADDLVNYMPFTGPNFVVGGTSYPAALMVCTNCSYVRTYMAVPMGLLDASEEPKSDE